MNENDSEKLAGMLHQMGWQPAEAPEKAGLIIVNTCSVRENADDRAFGNIGKLKTYKRNNPDMILAVCGCMMQQPEIVRELRRMHPQVDIIFGTHNLHRFPQILGNFIAAGEQITEIWDESDAVVEDVPAEHKYPFKAYVTIMQGCNNFCSYCIVPYTRGREHSRRPEKILEEIRNLADQGVIEVTLLGQNVNSYGNDLEDGISFASLLRQVNEIDGIKRIRFMTSNPKDFTDDVILAMQECERVMPSCHLAMQSGSTRIIKKMNRHYTKEQAIDLVTKIKKEVPGAVVTTDIIVGFPGETEDDFQDTLDLVRACKFDSAFSFIYSKRIGTPAAEMPDQIPDAVKHDRLNRLLAELHLISADINAPFQDQTVAVLAEGPSARDESRLSGRTPGGKLVNFTGNASDIGKIVPVHIDHAGTFSLTGTRVNEDNGKCGTENQDKNTATNLQNGNRQDSVSAEGGIPAEKMTGDKPWA
jgi:tRNA-2-methylthio-N6-dimethylallyladenosine synthase